MLIKLPSSAETATLPLLLAVAVGGALGAMARYVLSEWAQLRWGLQFPWGTLIVNLLGCFALGLVYGLLETVEISAALRPAVTVGFLGAFTTFSTFSYETLLLVEGGQALRAAGYVALSVAVGLALSATGLALGRILS